VAIIQKLIYGEHSVRADLDNGESLKLPYSVVSDYSLRSGSELEGEFYVKIYDESLKFACMDKALRYLSLRSRSAFEVGSYLKKKLFRAEHIESVISRLAEKGYINDYDFALSFIKSRMALKKYGRDIIRRDLYLKGIDRNIIDDTMEVSNANEVDEEALLSLAQKKYNAVKDKKNSYMKTAGFLKGRGFDYESIRKVLARVMGDDKDNQSGEDF
jgi:regulatory protein